jgi:hypothetical protein
MAPTIHYPLRFTQTHVAYEHRNSLVAGGDSSASH